MSDTAIIGSVPTLVSQMFSTSEHEIGHFYYSGAGTETSIMRKRNLISQLIEGGLK
jgi:hypothetical protein